MIRTTTRPIRVEDTLGTLETSCSGSLVYHIGLVRDNAQGRMVRAVKLSESGAAQKDLESIAACVREQMPDVEDVLIVHRYGRLDVGEIICIVAASAPHRGEAFAACQLALDLIKSLHSVRLTDIPE